MKTTKRNSHVLFILLIFARSFVNAAERTPNVIFMLTDDLGYSDVGCYGVRNVTTSHIDQLAAGGVRFTHFNMAASICSPSRAAFLTSHEPFSYYRDNASKAARSGQWNLHLGMPDVRGNDTQLPAFLIWKRRSAKSETCWL